MQIGALYSLNNQHSIKTPTNNGALPPPTNNEIDLDQHQNGNTQKQKSKSISWSLEATEHLLKLIQASSSSYDSAPPFWKHIAKTGFQDEQGKLIYTPSQCRNRVKYLLKNPQVLQKLNNQKKDESPPIDFAWIVLSMSDRFFSRQERIRFKTLLLFLI